MVVGGGAEKEEVVEEEVGRTGGMTAVEAELVVGAAEEEVEGEGPALMQPTPAQTNPGKQHPPPISDAHPVFPSAHIDTDPPHVAPAGQQPTLPSPTSSISTHVSDVLQQLFGYPMREQLVVPSGQFHCRR